MAENSENSTNYASSSLIGSWADDRYKRHNLHDPNATTPEENDESEDEKLKSPNEPPESFENNFATTYDLQYNQFPKWTQEGSHHHNHPFTLEKNEPEFNLMDSFGNVTQVDGVEHGHDHLEELQAKKNVTPVAAGQKLDDSSPFENNFATTYDLEYHYFPKWNKEGSHHSNVPHVEKNDPEFDLLDSFGNITVVDGVEHGHDNLDQGHAKKHVTQVTDPEYHNRESWVQEPEARAVGYSAVRDPNKESWNHEKTVESNFTPVYKNKESWVQWTEEGSNKDCWKPNYDVLVDHNKDRWVQNQVTPSTVDHNKASWNQKNEKSTNAPNTGPWVQEPEITPRNVSKVDQNRESWIQNDTDVTTGNTTPAYQNVDVNKESWIREDPEEESDSEQVDHNKESWNQENVVPEVVTPVDHNKESWDMGKLDIDPDPKSQYDASYTRPDQSHELPAAGCYKKKMNG